METLTPSLIKALAPAFAAGFAVQRFLEILDPVVDRVIGSERKKIILGLTSLVAGFGFASGLGVRVLANLGAYTFTGKFDQNDLLDLLVTSLVISAGTEGLNSILKFMNYKKEETKAEASTKAVTSAAAQAFGARTLNVACPLTRRDVSRLVLEVIRARQHDQTITEASIFGPQGINNDPEFRSTYFGPIKLAVEQGACRLTRFSPSDCENAGSVADIVNAVFADLNPAA
ncbi:MAG TPA: hypothetical protein VN643_24815 [Pyrinomonadaceae bacterium]|nr:hypothetical protein [Pyrinomonadaceae bacterium]